MAGLRDIAGLRVCMSGNGQGDIAKAIMAQLTEEGVRWVGDGPRAQTQGAADVAICTTGQMFIRDPSHVTSAEIEYLHEGNYLKPRLFTERQIFAMRRDKQRGLIIHIGSNAAWYGNVGAEDYASYKTALRKYLELRGRDVRKDGIRISLLGFGGVASKFWDKATANADPAWSKSIVPGDREPLSTEDVATLVVMTIKLPERMVVRDALAVAVDYQ